jgi:chromosome segregation ATPase
MIEKLQSRAKLSTVTVFTVLMSGLVSSQFPGGGSGERVLNLISPYFLWDIASWLDLALFVATWGALHFLTKPLLLEVYGFLLDNFPNSSQRNRYSTNSDGEVKGVSAASILTAFMAAQVVGMYIGPFGLIIIPAVGALAAIVGMYTGGSEVFSGVFGGDENQENEEIQERLERAERENQALREELERLSQEQDSDEENMQEGNENPEEAANHIKQELEQIKTIETQFSELEQQISQIEEEIRAEESEEQEELQEEEKIIQRIRDQQDKMGDALSRIDGLEEDVLERDQEIDQFINTSLKNPEQVNQQALSEDFKYNLEEIKNAREMGDQIRDIAQEEFSELRRVLEEEKDALKGIQSEQSQVQALQEEIEKLFKESDILESVIDEEDDVLSMAAEYAQEIKDTEDYQRLEEEEREFENLEEKIRSILNKERELRERLQELEEIEEQEEEENQQIIQELENLEKSLGEMLELVNKIDEELREVNEELVEEEDRVERLFLRNRGSQEWGQGKSGEEVFTEFMNEVNTLRDDIDDESMGVKAVLTNMRNELEGFLEEIRTES